MNGTKDTKSQTWFLTINNPTEEENDPIKALTSSDLKSIIKYAKAAREEGEANNTPHIHLYIHLTAQERFSAIKKVFPRAHIEEPIGTPRQQIDYIGNPEYIYSEHHTDPMKRGKPKGGICVWVKEMGDTTGLRLDRKVANKQTLDYRLSLLKDLVDGGCTKRDLYEQDFPLMVRYGEKILSYASFADAEKARNSQEKAIQQAREEMAADMDEAALLTAKWDCPPGFEKDLEDALKYKQDLITRLITDVTVLEGRHAKTREIRASR